MADHKPYTTQLQAGLGLVTETKTLLDLWSPGMSANQLHQVALDSGRFPTITARRLRNIVVECFAPRYLATGIPAASLKRLAGTLPTTALKQLMLVFTSRANPILGDFVRQIYWSKYAAGYSQITTEDARTFVERGMHDGKTTKRWSESTVRRVSAYLTGCCADYGMLEGGTRTARRMLPFPISPEAAAYLSHYLHFTGIGDNSLLTHEDWQLFGLTRKEVLEEVKRLSLRGLLVVQVASDAIRISWKHQTMEALCDVLAKG
jgi:hypothetical protein